MAGWETIGEAKGADGWETVGKAAAPSKPRTEDSGDPTSIGNLAGAATEPLLAMGTGALGSAAGGVAGIAGAALPGKEFQGADWSRKVSDALTYQPKTAGGKNAMKVIGAPFEKIAEGADVAGGKVAEMTGSPALGAGVNTALQAAPQILGSKGAGAAVKGLPRVLPKITPELRPGAQTMLDKGATLTPGQMFGGGWDRAEQALSKWPLVGAPIRAARGRAFEGFQEAAYNDVLAPIGETAAPGLKGHDAVADIQGRLGERYDSILERTVGRLGDEAQRPGTAVALRQPNALTPPPSPAAPTLRADLGTIRDMIDQSTLPNKYKREFGRIMDEDVLGRFQEGGVASGETIKDMDTNLRNLHQAKGRSENRDVQKVGLALREVRASIKRMLERENPDLAPELKATDAAYAKFKIIQKAAVSAGKSGEFSPAQLERAVREKDPSKDKSAFAKGEANMQDLAKAAREALGDPIPDSGTPFQLFVAALGGKGKGLLGIPGGIVGSAALAVPYSDMGLKAMRSGMTGPPRAAAGVARALPFGMANDQEPPSPL